MPPKQKEAKKGPTYKTATPLKDLLPPTVKEPPRESRPIKNPDSYPQIKNVDSQALLAEFPPLFEQWPNEQIVKGNDFGIVSDKKFEDPSHNQIVNHIVAEYGQSNALAWKNFKELKQIKEQFKKQNPDYCSSGDEQQQIEEKEEKKEGEGVEVEGSEQKIEEQEEVQKVKEMVVIETYMREQTEQEMEKRKLEEAEKAAQNAKDKKKGKKQEPKEEGPLQVSDVKMEDIRVRESMCQSGIWIGSQLQIIKQRQLRDVYTGESVWKKIYPQQNGVPKITQSGKYWVKLYHMGKAVKIEVDDRIPVNQSNKQLLPVSKKDNERWTLILAKALIKLFMKASPQKSMVGSGMIIYALTGLITQNISLSDFSDWNKIKKFMSDQFYTNKNIFVSVFSRNPNRNSPSNFIKNLNQMQSLLEFENSTFKNRRKYNREQKGEEEVEEAEEENNEKIEESSIKQKYIENHVISGYSYCIGDYLENGDFHMAFSRDRNATEKQLREQYSEFSKVSLGNKSREQKLQHRRKKKEVKQKLQNEQRKRLQQINRSNRSYHFLKLLGNITIVCEYTNKQILLAKRCILNELQKPPNYEIPTIEKQKQMKEQTKSGLSTSIIKMSKEEINASIEVNPSLDDFSALEKEREVKDILKRSESGVWIQDQDLLGTFDQLQIFYDPNSTIFKKNVGIESVQFKGAGQFSYEENSEILVIEKAGNPHLEEGEEILEETKKEVPQNIRLLFGYSYQQSQWDTLGTPYSMLQKFDFDSYRTTSTVSKLSTPLSSSFLELKNQNTVFKLYTMSKGRYAYWISCSAPYKLLSIAKYLEEIENYSNKPFTIEYPPLEASTYFPIARFQIKQANKQGNTLLLKFENTAAFKNIEKFLNFKLVQIPEVKEQQPLLYTRQKNEGVIQKIFEKTYMINEYTRIELAPLSQDRTQKNYYLVVQAFPNTALADGTLNLQILSKNQGDEITQIEEIQPYKIVEKYVPNKYANIMKERIFTSKANNVSILFKIVQGEEGQPLAAGGKGGNKKGGKQQQVFQIIEKPLSQKRLLHFKLFKNNSLMYYSKGYNQIVIPNLSLAAKQNQKDNQYYVEASFDLRDWPEANSAQQTEKIYWSCQIYGDESIAFVKDTTQEEKEKQTRKSWEDKQSGRAEKAKRSRQRYLLECRKQKGQQLTEQELAIVNAPRMTRKQLMQEQKKNEDKKGGKGAKKDDKKGGKDKKQEVVEEKKQERPLPKSQDNFMTELKQFLKNLENCKVQHIALKQNQQPRIRSKQQQEAIKEAATMSVQNRTGQIVRNIQIRQTMKIREKDKKDKLTILLEDSRNAFSDEWKKYIEWRIQDKQKDQVKQEKQKAIIDIIVTAIDKEKTVTSTEADLNKIVTEYKEIEGYSELMVDAVEMIRKNIRISNLVEKINGLLAGWQVDELKNVREEMEKDRVEGIDEQLIKQVNDMLEQAEKNPALVQEKQAEMKKGKKGGKK